MLEDYIAEHSNQERDKQQAKCHERMAQQAIREIGTGQRRLLLGLVHYALQGRQWIQSDLTRPLAGPGIQSMLLSSARDGLPFRNPEDRLRFTTFLRVAALLEDLSALMRCVSGVSGQTTPTSAWQGIAVIGSFDERPAGGDPYRPIVTYSASQPNHAMSSAPLV